MGEGKLFFCYRMQVERSWLDHPMVIVLSFVAFGFAIAAESRRTVAQEAQRLRRKKHAENRMLDMKRRQKQRLEEMRETEKKDKETMDLKEQLRMEVGKSLSNLESECSDMPSLLRGLGVHVASPSIHEVHAAYKRSLLKFHPDRASRTDVRQQVEAEEKFKLISRMKENSCR